MTRKPRRPTAMDVVIPLLAAAAAAFMAVDRFRAEPDAYGWKLWCIVVLLWLVTTSRSALDLRKQRRSDNAMTSEPGHEVGPVR